ncbi:MAG: STAS domain-containing protein, partial [Fibrobacter sp.]|nr:STAS domain-containing protein [Fibrobacter sp.]
MEAKIIKIPDKPRAAILQFSGEMDSGQIGKINDLFSQIDSSVNYVIVDVKSVETISSAVIGELMSRRKDLIELGGDLVIAGIVFSIRTKLNLIGLTKIFRIFSDSRAALNAYRWEIEHHAEKIHVSFPSHLKIVPPVRQLISRIAKQKGYGNRDSFRLETIVDEICNNAVEHGLQGNDLSVELDMSID